MARLKWISGDPLNSAKLNQGGINPVTITYSGANVATVKDNTTNVTVTLTYSAGRIASVTDGTNTWTVNRTAGKITSVSEA